MRALAVAAFLVLSTSCRAGEFPIVGLLEQHPVAPDGAKVIARPFYILTNRKLTEPTVFTGLQGSAKVLSAVCCFQVRNLTPRSMARETSTYRVDTDFVEHMNGIKGYAYVYVAEPVSDRRSWTPLMVTVMENAGNPQDASPFSAPVVAATFSQSLVPSTFTVGGAGTGLSTRYDAKSDRMVYSFRQGQQTIVFSEPATPH